MNILTVDDEYYSRAGIMDMLKEAGDEHKLYEAGNAHDAIELCRSFHIDVVITDIRMPDMDGLEMIETLVPQHPDMMFVIISGYDDFSYAQKALRIGAVDFILKPIGVEELQNTVNKLCTMKQEKKHDNSIFAEKYLLSMIQGSYYDREIMNSFYGESPVNALLFDCLDSLEEHDAFDLDAELALVLQQENYLIISPGGNMIFATGVARETEQIAEKINTVLAKTAKPILGAACTVKSYSGLFAAYNNLLNILEPWQYIQSNILLEAKINPKITFAQEDLDKQIVQTQVAMQSGHRKKMLEQADNLFKYFEHSFCAPEIVYHTLLSLQVFIKEYIKKQNLGKVASMHHFSSLRLSLKELHQEFMLLLVRCSNLMASKIDSHDNAISEAIRYINDHYTENVSLSEIAGKVHLNTSYLSRKIKEQTSLGFTKYLLKLRMEHAIELLKDNYSVTQVADLVGYQDYRQFSQQFKEYSGQNPSKFAKKQ